MARILIGNIKGPKGDTGPQGPQGATGPQGPQGPLPPLVNNALATEAGVSALDAAMGKTLQDQITQNTQGITQLNSKLPVDSSYYVSVIPRIKNIVAASDQPSLLADIKYMIQDKGILSGEYGYSETKYTDVPSGVSQWGYVKYFQHADNYVTVIIFPDTHSAGWFTNQFIVTQNQWAFSWKTIGLTEA